VEYIIGSTIALIGVLFGAFRRSKSYVKIESEKICLEKEKKDLTEKFNSAKLEIEKTKINSQESIEIYRSNVNRLIETIDSERFKNITSFFNNPSILSLQNNIIELLDQRDKINKLIISVDKLNRLVDDRLYNSVTGRIHTNIEHNQSFTDRLRENEPSKIFFKNHFTELSIVKDILCEKESIFIESGSTLAYCMLNIIDKIKDIREKPLRVCTNNASIYMMLLYENSCIPKLFPGVPDNKYGATFGETKNQAEVDKFLSDNRVEAIFATSSFFDLKYGPHVGSTENWNFKRFLNNYSMKHCIMNFHVIVSEKIVDGTNIGKDCKFIFDENGCNFMENPKAMIKTKEEFKAFFRKKENVIITASYDKILYKERITAFRKEHLSLFPHEISPSESDIEKKPIGTISFISNLHNDNNNNNNNNKE